MNEFEESTKDAIELLAQAQKTVKDWEFSSYSPTAFQIMLQRHVYLIALTTHAMGHLIATCIEAKNKRWEEL